MKIDKSEEFFKLLSIAFAVLIVIMVIMLVNMKPDVENSNDVGKVGENPVVVIETSMGDIKVELFDDKAPITVANFLSYVNDSFYDGLVFHRVIDGFMIQGGGFEQDGSQKQTKSPITLESYNGLNNTVGTIAMARTSVPNSATSQFFINVKDNDFLNYAGSSNPGYAVFGEVVSGMDVVNSIKGVKTTVKNGMQDWPVQNVVIKRIYVEK